LIVIVENLYDTVEHEFLEELEAKKVKVVTDESLLVFLVFELAHLQLLQGMSCLKFD
jgi:hypothetical protein